MFIPHSYDNGLQPWEYLPAAAGTYQVGQALTVTSGKLAAIKSASTTTPPYICMAEVTVADGEAIPVIRVRNEIIFETTLSAASASAAIGTKLQVAAQGLEVNGADTGTFDVVYIEGTAAGSIVRGRFQ